VPDCPEELEKTSKEIVMKIIVITGASSGFGALTARALAKAGHTAYASMRDTTGQNAPQVEEAKKFAKENKVDLRSIELDVTSQASVDAAIQKIVDENKRLDVVIHNAGHMVFGPAEAFTPEQLAELYDINVLSTQRVNRAALPQLRKQRNGLLVWVSSSSSAGGTPPYLAPYFAAKAGMDALAVVYARELTRWGIESSIIVPGAFTGGTNHFANAGSPSDKERVAEYEAGPYKGFADDIMKGFTSIVPPEADVSAVAEAIVKVVDTPFGKRPFRVHVNPTQDGAEVVNMVLDRVRTEMLRRIGLADVLTPRTHSDARPVHWFHGRSRDDGCDRSLRQRYLIAAAVGHVHWLGRIFHAETLGARRSRELDLPCARLGIGYRRFLGNCHADA
jgi:NAD(P)-dependent dehydrogenase (short-subunit alcohol dehydrogenase family)